ncbi:GntR family transcriptional regulator [Paracoccus sp. M683]|uniref:GntR family transcriptional regulator n=1 Tax=Paracoccus sp. M683 TaxID=2594268 RepID=UPI00163D58FB|nr:GntR family transcriptional regulator [Paracoccus sp. M683]
MNTRKAGRQGRGKSDLKSKLAAQIANHIQERPLSAGTHMSAQILADQMGTSRSPIHAAFLILAEMGVLRHETNRGFFVTEAAHEARLSEQLPSRDHLSDAYFAVADQLLDGDLPSTMSEVAFRDRFGLTQVEARSLLSQIQKEGWIERRPGYGWEFNEMLRTPDALAQTYRMRQALEPAALLEPGFSISAETLDRLAATERDFLNGEIETASAEKLYQRGVTFHETLMQASGNRYMLDALRRVNQIRRLIVYRSMVDRKRYYKQSQEHLEIIQLVRRGAMNEAAVFMRHHLSNVMLNHEEIAPLLHGAGNG